VQLVVAIRVMGDYAEASRAGCPPRPSPPLTVTPARSLTPTQRETPAAEPAKAAPCHADQAANSSRRSRFITATGAKCDHRRFDSDTNLRKQFACLLGVCTQLISKSKTLIPWERFLPEI